MVWEIDNVLFELTFSASLVSSKSRFCFRTGTGRALSQTSCHILPGIFMRWLNSNFFTVCSSFVAASTCFSSTSTQSRGEYHRTKSSSTQPGLAAFNFSGLFKLFGVYKWLGICTLKLCMSDRSEALWILALSRAASSLLPKFTRTDACCSSMSSVIGVDSF